MPAIIYLYIYICLWVIVKNPKFMNEHPNSWLTRLELVTGCAPRVQGTDPQAYVLFELVLDPWLETSLVVTS